MFAGKTDLSESSVSDDLLSALAVLFPDVGLFVALGFLLASTARAAASARCCRAWLSESLCGVSGTYPRLAHEAACLAHWWRSGRGVDKSSLEWFGFRLLAFLVILDCFV